MNNDTTRNTYTREVTKNLDNSAPGENIEKEWQVIKQGVVDAAKTVFAERRKIRRGDWYDDEYAKLLQQKNEARLLCLQNGTEANKALYRGARDVCRKTARKKSATSKINGSKN